MSDRFVLEAAALGRGLQLLQARLQPLAEPRVHGAFFLAAVGAAGQDERFLAARSGNEFHLHARLHGRPILLGKVLLELPQHGLGRSDDVLAAVFAKVSEVVFTDHPAVHHPHAADAAILFLHDVDHLLHGRGIMRVTGKHLVAQRKAVFGDH
jgi:hypothetical protein